ncbi:MAG: chloramphenicol acetyltransferase [Saprospiraceae bacterium]|nr:chloramphenicol acetyltransferase [Saprospiraceae bacterium]
MSQFTTIETKGWKREAAFRFFRHFDDPFFNISTNVDVTELHHFCKLSGLPFSLCTQFFAAQTANEIEELRLRLVGGEVRLYDLVHCGATVLHDDDTFSFCYYEMKPDLRQFVEDAKQLTQHHKQNPSFDPGDDIHDVLHCSVVPWISFTAVKHARRFGREDSIPKLVFGKKFEQAGRWLMPVSLEAHHGLMDGLHAGRFFEGLQLKLDAFDVG